MPHPRPLHFLAPGALCLLIALGPVSCGKKDTGAVQLVYGFAFSFRQRGTQPDSLTTPEGVAVFGSGNLIDQVWVAENSANRATRYNFSGGYRGTVQPAEPLHGAISLAATLRDTLVYVLESDRPVLRVVGRSGVEHAQLNYNPGGLQANGVATDDTLIYVSQQGISSGFHGQAEVLDRDGHRVRLIGAVGPGALPSASAIAVDDSSVWISNPIEGKMCHFLKDGTFLGGFGVTGTGPGQWTLPGPVAVTDDGHLLIVDRSGDGDRVQEYRPDGTFVTQFGRDKLGSPAGFEVSAIAVYSNSLVGEYIYLTERSSQRVYVVIRRYVRATSSPTQPG